MKPKYPFFYMLMFLALALAACSLPGQTPEAGGGLQPPTPFVITTPISMESTPLPEITHVPVDTPPVGFVLAQIRGTVWKDLCSRGAPGQPAPAIPPAGCVVNALGGFQANAIREAAEPRLSGVVVSLGSGACPSIGLSTTTTDTNGEYVFANLNAGVYCVTINLNDPVNSQILLPGAFSYPSPYGSAGSQTITVHAGEDVPWADFGWDSQFQTAGLPPTAAPTQAAPTQAPPTQAPTAAPTTTAYCTYKVAFVDDITIPDDTVLNPGTAFTKVWRVRNDGTCTWGPNYPLFGFSYTGGSQLSGPDVVRLPVTVVPGQVVDLAVDLVAPNTPGAYTSEWKLRVKNDPSGFGPYLGLGANRDKPLFTRIQVPAPADQIPVTKVSFAPGGTSAIVEGKIQPGQIKGYTFRALKGQTLMATLSASDRAVGLTVLGEKGDTIPLDISSDKSQIRAQLPATQTYQINVVGGYAKANFSLNIIIPSRISFEPGAISARMDGQISGHLPVTYLLRAMKGQTMTVTITSASDLALTIYGLEDGQPLVRANGAATKTWTGQLPGSQDYVIMVVPAVDTATYTLETVVK